MCSEYRFIALNHVKTLFLSRKVEFFSVNRDLGGHMFKIGTFAIPHEIIEYASE